MVVPRPAEKCGGLGTLKFSAKSKIWENFVEVQHEKGSEEIMYGNN